jgi:hypothetical protein
VNRQDMIRSWRFVSHRKFIVVRAWLKLLLRKIE